MKHDKRKNYKPLKITILELWFRFEYFGRNYMVSKLGIDRRLFDKIIKEWEDNDGYLIVESKINLHNQN